MPQKLASYVLCALTSISTGTSPQTTPRCLQRSSNPLAVKSGELGSWQKKGEGKEEGNERIGGNEIVRGDKKGVDYEICVYNFYNNSLSFCITLPKLVYATCGYCWDTATILRLP